MSEFTVDMSVNAKPEAVFSVYTDHVGFADLVPLISKAEIEREGTPPPNGLGAVRRLYVLGAKVREEVTDYHYPARYSYEMLSGVPLDEYVATVTFTPEKGGTVVSYWISVVAPGPIPVKFPIEEFVRLFMRNANEAAERINA